MVRDPTAAYAPPKIAPQLERRAIGHRPSTRLAPLVVAHRHQPANLQALGNRQTGAAAAPLALDGGWELCQPRRMPDVIVVGDGPGGLSAALFLAKNGKSVVVFGQDKTAMHWALLKNYLGIPEIHGSEFQKIARQQVEHVGGSIRAERVEAVATAANGYAVTVEGGETVAAKYLVLSEGKSPKLATMLGLQHDPNTGVPADRNGATAMEGVYVVGRLARPGRSQAIISAGDGAAVAIDILSREKGENFADWDSPPEDES